MRMTSESSRNPNLKHNKTLYEVRLIFGVPSKLFIVAALLVVAVWISAGFVASLAIFCILIPPLVIVCKGDEKGLVFLLDKFKRPEVYSAGVVSRQGVKVVEKQRDEFILNTLENSK